MRIAEVIEAVDGRVELDQGVRPRPGPCNDEASCALHDVWKLFRQNYSATLSSMTLRDAADVLRAKRSAHGVPDAKVAHNR